MPDPHIADTKPQVVDVKAGETIWWCHCGLSKKQPHCDGSHQGTDFTPLEFIAEKEGKVAFCLCKHTAKEPRCDGSHDALPPVELEVPDASRTTWYKVAEAGEMRDGGVRSVQAGSLTLALTCFDGQIGALDNACPHQGGPLSEGSIECTDGDGDCWLRCPWHGWDFHPLTGNSPGGHDDGVKTYPVEERDDGIYVAVQESAEHAPTVSAPDGRDHGCRN